MKHIKVLAIDDNQDNLTSLKAILEDTIPEARVYTATSGRKGLAMAIIEQPDVILLDIVMPGLSGFEVCKELKEDLNLVDTPVVFLTALKTDRESQIRALEAGAEAFLSKPLDEQELTAVVRTMAKIRATNELKHKEKERLSSLVQERSGELKEQTAKRSMAERRLEEANRKLQRNQSALLNLLADLKMENQARIAGEQELLASRERYKLLFTQMSEGFALHEIILSPTGKPVDYRFLEVNPAFEAMTGLEAGVIIGKSVREVIPDIEESWINRYGVVARSGNPDEFSQFSRSLNKWFHVSVFSPVKGRFATIFTDVTERVKMEQALRESETKFRGIAEQVGDMIFMTDKKGTLLYLSPASLHTIGYEPYEMIGHHFERFLDKGQITEARKRFRLAMKTKQTDKALILKMKRKNGSCFFGEMHAAPYVQDGVMLGTIGLIRDITDRLNDEQALRESAQKLRDLTTHIQEVREEERKEIAQDLHDDLGQRLTALNIDLAWLAGRIPVDYPELSQKVNSMHALLLESVVRLKQISSSLRPSILDDLGIAAAIGWQANDFMARTDARCSVKITPEELEMPPDTTTQVFRIVQEALTNIMRHADASKVEISLIEKKDAWHLKITDDGVGFSEADLENKQSFGLSGMEERAIMCGGTFLLRSDDGAGTEITVEIPKIVNRKS